MRELPRVPRVLPSDLYTLGRPSRTDCITLSFVSDASLIIHLRQINHHLETIAQLRHEATQWKTQCLRLEETSRQEAISWKEQFLRVEQERSKLAQRVEELVAEQLGSVRSPDSNCMPDSLSTFSERTYPNIGHTIYSHDEVFRHRRLICIHPITACPRALFLNPRCPRIPSIEICILHAQDNLERK